MNVETRINFFVIGAAKCGTTTLYSRLKDHPEVFLSPLKEPNYHSRDDIDPARFSPAFRANTKVGLADYLNGPDPLPERQVGFVRKREDYLRLFSGVEPSHKVVGECSTSYLWSPTAPEVLKKAHPHAKLVISLRDPVERVFSHYMMARKYGFVQGSVLDAVRADEAHPDPSWGRSELFLELSRFDKQIARWRRHFDEDQIRVLEPGALRDPATWKALEEWLGLSPYDWNKVADKDANQAGLSRFEGLNRWLTQRGLKKALASMVPSGWKDGLLRWYYRSDDLPRLTDEERSALKAMLDAPR